MEMYVKKNSDADVPEHQNAAENLRHQNAILEGINRILTESLKFETEEQIGVLCLSVAEDLTESRSGFIGEIGPDGNLHDIAISDPGWKQCSMYDQSGHRRLSGDFKLHGLYGHVLRDSKSLLSNDPSSHPDSIGTPKEHPPIESFLGVPLTHEGKTIGVIALGNREGGYSPVQQEAIQAIAPAIVQAFSHRKYRKALTGDLDALTRVHELSRKLIDSDGVQPLLQDIMDAAVTIIGADKGTLQLFADDSLRIVAHHGHDRTFLEFFELAHSRASVCGEAMRCGERVTVPDIEESGIFAGTPSLWILRKAGLRAVQSTPIMSRGGTLLGILTTQWRIPYAPDEHDLWRVDLLVRQAADLIEHAKAEEALRESEQLYRTLFGNTENGFALVEPIFDETGKSDDYRMLEVNAAWERQTGLRAADFVGKRIREVMPDAERVWAATYAEVVRTGVSKHLENYNTDSSRWYDAHLFLFRQGQVGVLFRDITERKRAEEKLRESEQLYRTLFGNTENGFALVEPIFDETGESDDYRMLEVNAAWERQTGLRAADFVGKRIREVMPDAERVWAATFAEVAKTGTANHFESYNADSGRWYDLHAFRYRTGRVGVLFRDITARKRHELNLDFLNEISQELVGLTSIDETMAALGKKIGAHFNASQCAFGEVDEDQQFVTVTHEWRRSASPILKGAHRIGDFHTEDFRRASRSGEACVVRDALNDLRANAEQMAALSIGSFVSVPLVRDGEWRFNLSIFDSSPRDWRKDEIELMRLLTARIWARLERARAEEALWESEARLHAVINSIADEVWFTDVDGNILLVNDAVISNLGLAGREAVFRNIEEAVAKLEVLEADGTPRGSEQTLLTRALQGEVLRSFGEQIRNLSTAELRFREVTASPVHDPDGRIIGAVAVVRDVTERKRAEEALKRSEAVYRSIARNFPNGAVYVFDRDLRFLVVDGEALSFIGWNRETLEGSSVSDLDEGTRRVIEPRYRRILGGESMRFETDYRGRIMLSSYVPIRDSSNEVIMGMVVAVDITHLKQAEEALQKSESRFRLLSETSARLLSSDNPQQIIEDLCRKVMVTLDCHAFFNFLVDEQAGRLRLNSCAGIPEEEAKKIEWLDFGVAVCGCVALDRSRIVVGNIFNTPDPRTELVKSYGFQAYACHPLMAGEKFMGTLSFGSRSQIQFLPDQLELMETVSNQVAVAMERMRLIRELEKSRNELELRVQERTEELALSNNALAEHAAKLERFNQELEEFAWIAAHDLQEPLRKIQTFGLRLQTWMGSLSKEGQEDLRRMIKAAGRMATLIRDLKSYSDVTRDTHALVTIPLSRVIRGVISDLEFGIREAKAQIEVSNLPSVHANQTMMHQLFQNLIGNAIKYARENESPIIKITSQVDNGTCRIHVEDNGIGFEEQYLDQIFKPFKRLHGKKSNYEGTGMGLAICRKVVEMHGGTITARSTPGEGSTFIITLPMKQKKSSSMQV